MRPCGLGTDRYAGAFQDVDAYDVREFARRVRRVQNAVLAEVVRRHLQAAQKELIGTEVVAVRLHRTADIAQDVAEAQSLLIANHVFRHRVHGSGEAQEPAEPRPATAAP